MRKWLVVIGLVLCASMVSAEYEYKVWREQVNFSNAEAMNSIGDYFTTLNNASLADGASIWYLIDLTTATKNIYLDFEFEASTGIFTSKIGRSPVVTSSGTLTTTIYNYNQTRRKPSILSDHLYLNDSVITVNGTLLFGGMHSGKEIYRNPVTWVLEAGEHYSIVLTNTLGSTQTIQLRLMWYEK